MDIEEIGKTIGKFKIERLCDTVMGYNPHDAIIGEWVRWWVSDSVVDARKRRRIINPAIAISKDAKKKAYADLLFVDELEPDSDYFEVVGVAEVENGESKFFEKLENLSFYEQNGKSNEERKFPDLQFALLCSKAKAEYCKGVVVVKDIELFDTVKRKMQEYSEKSSICWVLYLLLYMKHEEKYNIIVKEYVRGYLGFYYNYAFSGSEFFTYYKGKQMTHESFLINRQFSKSDS